MICNNNCWRKRRCWQIGWVPVVVVGRPISILTMLAISIFDRCKIYNADKSIWCLCRGHNTRCKGSMKEDTKSSVTICIFLSKLRFINHIRHPLTTNFFFKSSGSVATKGNWWNTVPLLKVNNETYHRQRVLIIFQIKTIIMVPDRCLTWTTSVPISQFHHFLKLFALLQFLEVLQNTSHCFVVFKTKTLELLLVNAHTQQPSFVYPPSLFPPPPRFITHRRNAPGRVSILLCIP